MTTPIQFAGATTGDKPASVLRPQALAEAGNLSVSAGGPAMVAGTTAAPCPTDPTVAAGVNSVSARRLPAETATIMRVGATPQRQNMVVADNHRVFHHRKSSAQAISSNVAPITTAKPGDISMEKSS